MEKQDIKNIIAEAKSLSSYEERLSFLKDKFKGETCYIVSCGPSLKDVDKDKLFEKVKDTCLFSVKQSYFPFKDMVDFHFFNTNNYINYPNNDDAFFVGSSDWNTESIARAMYWKNQQVDLCTKVAGKIIGRDSTGLGKVTSAPLTKKQYNDDFKGLREYTFEKTGLIRQWGAGIMYENVLFFAYHLGFSKIKTIGWDYAKPDHTGIVEHFYPESSRIKTLNPCKVPYETEMFDSINLSEAFFHFMSKSETLLEAHISDKCFLSKKIRRYKI